MPVSEDLPRHVSRRLVLFAGLAAPATLKAAPQPCEPPRVLFVCPAGTVKSAIARETLRQRASAAGVPVRVISRGISPEDHVSPELAARLKGDGIDPTAEPARALTAADVANADIVIAFDAAAQSPLLSGAVSWKVPSWNGDYAGAKAALAAEMTALLAGLKTRPCRSPATQPRPRSPA